MAELIVQTGKHQGRRLRFSEAEITIGRDDDCQIRLTSVDVSKRHCRLRFADGALSVQDLGSSNGTFVNDVRIDGETRLAPGDRLRIGPMVLEVPAAAKKRAGDKPAGGKKSDRLSEEDIASWLTDDTDHGEVSSADTTVILTAAAPAAAAETSSLAVAAAAAGPQDDRKKFRTIADEAADIIRRWWQMQKE